MNTSIATTAQYAANMIDAVSEHLESDAAISSIIDNAFEAALVYCNVLCLPGEEMPERDYDKACQQTLHYLAKLGQVAERAFLEFALKMFEEHPGFWQNLSEWRYWVDVALQDIPISDTLKSTIHNAVPGILFRLKHNPVVRLLPNGQTVGVDHTTFLGEGKATFAREIMGHIASLNNSPEDQQVFEDWVLLAGTQKRSNLRALLNRPDIDVNQVLMGYIDPGALGDAPLANHENEIKKPEITVRIFNEVDHDTGEKVTCNEYTIRVSDAKDMRFVEQQLSPRFEFHFPK